MSLRTWSLAGGTVWDICSKFRRGTDLEEVGCCLGWWVLRVITDISACKLSVDTICSHMLTVPPSWLNNLSSLQSLLWSILSQGQVL